MIVGMSAGVDSSVAAAILKEQGYDVVGLFLRLWKEPEEGMDKGGNGFLAESEKDARSVAKALNIPFCAEDASQEFKKHVVKYFIDELKSGRTPNPCVVCNEKIKFSFLFKKMLEMGADFVATGHYAKIGKKDGAYHMYAACDEEKDQTYFLYNLTEKQLSRILFPLDSKKKAETRKIAKKMRLPVFDRGDSQDICFTREKEPAGFIRRNVGLSSGDIVIMDGTPSINAQGVLPDGAGKKIGTHEGLELYTIGQRKGINLGGNGPYYVVDRDFENNRLVVTNDKNDPGMCKKRMLVEAVNWIAGRQKLPLEADVKIRYRNQKVRAIINSYSANSEKLGAMVEIEFLEPQKAVTPGQSAVFYADDNEVLGGGIIK